VGIYFLRISQTPSAARFPWQDIAVPGVPLFKDTNKRTNIKNQDQSPKQQGDQKILEGKTRIAVGEKEVKQREKIITKKEIN
jgi:hypothetical protein